MARYNDTIIRKDKNGQTYLSTEVYPSFSKKDSDIILVGRYGTRMDNLANQYYGDSKFWWVIAKANQDLFDGSLFLKVGKTYRIPTDLSPTGQEIMTGGGEVGSVTGGSSSGGSSGGGGGY